MNRLKPLCVLVCLLLAGCPLHPGWLPTNAQTAERCKHAERWEWNGHMLWGTRRTWSREDSQNEKDSVLVWANLDGAVPALELKDDHYLVGERVIGAVMPAVDSAERPTAVAICDAQSPADDPGMVSYTIEVWNRVDQAWENPCIATEKDQERDKLPPKALLVGGIWDGAGAHHGEARKITFACQNGVINKCVAWGYRPWEVRGKASLADVHQACTRMARADYCGDGTSHTRNQTAIDYMDSFGINKPSTEVSPEWNPAMASFEASWAPDGASCIARTRHGEKLETILQECPGRFVPGTTKLSESAQCVLQRSDATNPAGLVQNLSLTSNNRASAP